MTNTPLVLADSSGIASLTCFVLYTVIILGVAWLSHRFLSGRRFASEYFLGSRGFGPIAFTLTFGATSASAGSFAGFPALDLYTRLGAGLVDCRLCAGAHHRHGFAWQAA